MKRIKSAAREGSALSAAFVNEPARGYASSMRDMLDDAEILDQAA